MLPKTIIKDVRKSPALMNNPRTLLRLNAEFKDMGFKEVRLDTRVNDTTFCDDLTLAIHPDFSGIPSDGYSYESCTPTLRTFLESMQGFHPDFYFKSPLMDKTDKFEVIIKRGLRNTKFEFGCYVKERNLVILYYPIINRTELSLGKDNKIFEVLFEEFKKWISNVKLERVDVKARIREIMVSKFFSETEEKIENNKAIIRDSETRLQLSREDIALHYRKIASSKEELEFLTKLGKDKGKEFLKKIKAIETLDFVKKVELTDIGLIVDVGKIVLQRGTRKYELGNYKIIIKPRKVEIENDKPVNRGSIHQHPHEVGGDICFGSGKEKAYDLLGQMKLKELVYFMYLFLKSYNPKDPHIKLTEFIGFQNEQYGKKQEIAQEEKEKDFESEDEDDDEYDEDGELISPTPVTPAGTITRTTSIGSETNTRATDGIVFVDEASRIE